MPSIKALGELKFLTTRIRLDAVRVVTSGAESGQARIKALTDHLEEMDRVGKQYDKLISNVDERKYWTAFSQKWPTYIRIQEEALALELDSDRLKDPARG